jgi:hypothetical protein
MGINESDVERFVAGSMSKDDPAWGEVSAFLKSLDSAYPVESVAQFEDRHLPALASEARLIAGGHDLGKRRSMKDIFAFKTHRALIATIAAALLLLTAGVGVASAMGVNPLAHLAPASDPVVTPEPTAPTESAAPTPEPTDDEADDEADEPGDDIDEDASPTASPTRTHDSEEADDVSDEGDDSSEEADDSTSDSGDNEDADSSDGDKAGSDDGDDEGQNSSEDGSDKGGDNGGGDKGENGGSDKGGNNG